MLDCKNNDNYNNIDLSVLKSIPSTFGSIKALGVINNLLTDSEACTGNQIKLRPYCIDRAFEVNKYFIIWRFFFKPAAHGEETATRASENTATRGKYLTFAEGFCSFARLA